MDLPCFGISIRTLAVGKSLICCSVVSKGFGASITTYSDALTTSGMVERDVLAHLCAPVRMAVEVTRWVKGTESAALLLKDSFDNVGMRHAFGWVNSRIVSVNFKGKADSRALRSSHSPIRMRR